MDPQRSESDASATPADHHRRVRATPSPARMQLNLTSMIDVIFLLLVYFVITANFAVGEGVITARLPDAPADRAAADQPPTLPLIIEVASAGDALSTGYSLRLSGKAIDSFSALQQALIDVQRNPDAGRLGFFDPDNPVVIQADTRVRWQHVVNAFNAAVAARYSNVRFAGQ